MPDTKMYIYLDSLSHFNTHLKHLSYFIS